MLKKNGIRLHKGYPVLSYPANSFQNPNSNEINLVTDSLLEKIIKFLENPII